MFRLPGWSPKLKQRFRPLWWLALTYLVMGAATRIVLLAMTGSGVPLDPLLWLYAFGVGACYDLITLLYVAWPLMLFLWIVPTDRALIRTPLRWAFWLLALVIAYGLCWVVLHALWRVSASDIRPLALVFIYLLPLPALAYNGRSGRIALAVLYLATIFGLLFVAASELVFWDEFGVRFNFIAVDYLVYTTEVIGNIRESYPVGLWMTLIGVLALAILWLNRRGLRARDAGSRFAGRGAVAGIWLVLTVLSVAGINATLKDRTGNNFVNELAGNGIYQFFAAFRSSHLDYAHFYRTLPERDAFARVRAGLLTPEASYISNDPHDLTRAIRNPGPEKHLNVVLISVESLSADFLTTLGASHGEITPYLDGLAKDSLFFDNVYANGTRTVRGLEALSLSIPPTPGDSVIKMKHNENLFSLADIFNDRGYVSEFVYGGYGYFDNMNYFFDHNGYIAVDRKDIPKDATIHHENVWGVADEDLYTLALGQMDKIHREGKPFFLHVMTTSNHRPFTFPADRVNFPQGSREGAVAYTDWSIADFIRRARAKPYFDDTVFVITADHDASSSGKVSIPVNRYHIPLWIYSPKHITPRRVGRFMSQIDIPPTLLGLLNFSYRSRFFGYDIFQLQPGRERAFPATYEKLGYLRGGLLTILEPQKKVEQFRPDFVTGDAAPVKAGSPGDIDDATAYYQVAAELFKQGKLVRRPQDSQRPEALPADAHLK
ncbi:LTA synthase family protein [Rhodanobacter denitrificans]|uniref:LTA synthase family protein n=1 Tax=Rhodanobacteraceae TaxID=1775411 RepID=UPI000260D088|nr:MULTISPECIES: LTA synthase family protein [Rhodanobacteraceae]EIM04301.1 phosphoglycerol transferase family protein, alkaline phosphatase superfamily [Rhodanobacter denitrificans]MCX7515239.1 LTA synthase family protein [Frateuria sp. STR12]UJM89009.1 LTA synthase family protein [Rhodanobacter denitrificans]